jgi:23S rRNA pseudouridine1911/1915/1917 synthase
MNDPVQISVASTYAGTRLDHVLQTALAGYSRARLQEWIRNGHVLVDSVIRKPSYILRGGESIQVSPQALPPLHAEPEDIPIPVLYEDEDVIAVDKPAGMVVHAGAGHHSGTLVNALLHQFGPLSREGGELRPGIVHRLDRDTSGVLLVARNDAAHRNLARQFATRTVKKTYLALVHGRVQLETGHLNKPITRDPVRRTRMTCRLGFGRAASTDYRVLQRWDTFTLLEVGIGTGRTHQIRVHLSEIGHPVVGDTLYGAPRKIEGIEPLGRFFLHSHRIQFQQPVTGEWISVESRLALELEAWMKASL